MSGIHLAFIGSAGFPPVTNTYNSGSGSDAIPTGATQVVITVWGGGGGGGYGDPGVNPGGGGGSGGYSQKTLALTGSDAGLTLNYTVGSGGAVTLAGGSSSSTNGTFGTTVNMAAFGGQPGTVTYDQGAGGAASGGDTNTTGNGSGGAIRTGAGAPNGGGNVSSGAGSAPGGGGAGESLTGGIPPGAGASGRVSFAYT